MSNISYLFGVVRFISDTKFRQPQKSRNLVSCEGGWKNYKVNIGIISYVFRAGESISIIDF